MFSLRRILPPLFLCAAVLAWAQEGGSGVAETSGTALESGSSVLSTGAIRSGTAESPPSESAESPFLSGSSSSEGSSVLLPDFTLPQPDGDSGTPYSPLFVPTSDPVDAPAESPTPEFLDDGSGGGGGTGYVAEEESASGASSDASELSFLLPGGYGSAPETIAAGQGRATRPPIAYSFTATTGFNDNLYSASRKGWPSLIPGHPFNTGTYILVENPLSPGSIPTIQEVMEWVSGHWIYTRNTPILASPYVQLGGGVEIFYARPRFLLTLDANAGSLYYLSRPGDPFQPVGGLSLRSIYKPSGRAQISAVVSGQYLAQPDFVLPNSVVRPGMGDYFLTNERIDLSYRWSARIASLTTFTLNTQSYMKSSSRYADIQVYTFGQSVSYALSPLYKAVAEVREAFTLYSDPRGGLNARNLFLLGGIDATLDNRMQGSFRFGENLCDYDQPDLPQQSAPYAEANFTYILDRHTSMNVNASYGINTGGSIGQRTQTTTHIGFTLNKTFTARLSAGFSCGWSHNSYGTLGGTTSSSDDTLGVHLSTQYQVNRHWAVFANLSRSQVFTSYDYTSYWVDSGSMGMNYRF